MSLSDLFNGERHWFKAGDDFAVEVKTFVVEEEDEEDLLGFESGTPELVFTDGRAVYPAGALPFQLESSAWAGVAMALKSLATCIGGAAESYQHNQYDELGRAAEPAYSFLFKPGPDGYQGGRI